MLEEERFFCEAVIRAADDIEIAIAVVEEDVPEFAI
jgi:hypothetical protein